MKLDFGCGAKPKKDHIGVDINPDKIRQAIQNTCDPSHFVGDITKQLSIKSESVEKIHCKEVIEHLTPPQAFSMLKEAERLLKDDGSIIIYTLLCRWSLYNTFDHVKPYPPQAFQKLLRGDDHYGHLEFKIARIKYKRLWGFYPVGYWIKLKRKKREY